MSHLYSNLHKYTGTRLRNAERLLSNLRAEDEIEAASNRGMEFPESQSTMMAEAISVYARLLEATEQEQGQGEEEEEEEEVEWEDDDDERE